jgi:hypothetical protein
LLAVTVLPDPVKQVVVFGPGEGWTFIRQIGT